MKKTVMVVFGLVLALGFYREISKNQAKPDGEKSGEEVGVIFYVIADQGLSEKCRFFVTEVEKRLDRALKLDKHAMINTHDVYIKEERAEITVPGGIKTYLALGLYVDSVYDQPLDWFYVEEIEKSDKKQMEEKIIRFVSGILGRLKDLTKEELKEYQNRAKKRFKNGLLVRAPAKCWRSFLFQRITV